MLVAPARICTVVRVAQTFETLQILTFALGHRSKSISLNYRRRTFAHVCSPDWLSSLGTKLMVSKSYTNKSQGFSRGRVRGTYLPYNIPHSTKDFVLLRLMQELSQIERNYILFVAGWTVKEFTCVQFRKPDCAQMFQKKSCNYVVDTRLFTHVRMNVGVGRCWFAYQPAAAERFCQFYSRCEVKMHSRFIPQV